MTRRRALLTTAIAALIGVAALVWRQIVAFPSDTTPKGAYFRIAAAVGRGEPRECFAYLEDPAQHAAYSVKEYRAKASEQIAAHYPEPERSRLLEAYRVHATARDGADVWVDLAIQRGWVTRLRRDLSGIANVEIAGERATIETVRGTRHAFRRRDNGMWGLTMFTAELTAEAERAARDWDVVQQAARDYERAH